MSNRLGRLNSPFGKGPRGNLLPPIKQAWPQRATMAAVLPAGPPGENEDKGTEVLVTSERTPCSRSCRNLLMLLIVMGAGFLVMYCLGGIFEGRSNNGFELPITPDGFNETGPFNHTGLLSPSLSPISVVDSPSQTVINSISPSSSSSLQASRSQTRLRSTTKTGSPSTSLQPSTTSSVTVMPSGVWISSSVSDSVEPTSSYTGSGGRTGVASVSGSVSRSVEPTAGSTGSTSPNGSPSSSVTASLSASEISTYTLDLRDAVVFQRYFTGSGEINRTAEGVEFWPNLNPIIDNNIDSDERNSVLAFTDWTSHNAFTFTISFLATDSFGYVGFRQDDSESIMAGFGMYVAADQMMFFPVGSILTGGNTIPESMYMMPYISEALSITLKPIGQALCLEINGDIVSRVAMDAHRLLEPKQYAVHSFPRSESAEPSMCLSYIESWRESVSDGVSDALMHGSTVITDSVVRVNTHHLNQTVIEMDRFNGTLVAEEQLFSGSSFLRHRLNGTFPVTMNTSFSLSGNERDDARLGIFLNAGGGTIALVSDPDVSGGQPTVSFFNDTHAMDRQLDVDVARPQLMQIAQTENAIVLRW